jgi:hypothetical protein
MMGTLGGDVMLGGYGWLDTLLLGVVMLGGYGWLDTVVRGGQGIRTEF